MSFQRHVSRLLDDDHRHSLALYDRLGKAMATRDPQALQALAGALLRQIDHELGHHFGFEESQLFTRLAEAGDEGIAALLTEEHDTLREVAAELRPLVLQLDAAAPDDATRRRLAPLLDELIERQVAHIQKETMALLPMLDELLDDDTDRELSLVFAEGG